MKMVSVLALVTALAAGTAHAQQQPLPMPTPDTPDLPKPQDIDYPGTLDLHIDATDTLHHVIAIHEVVPVAKAGDTVLLLPKWIPGTHSPEGDLTKIAGVHFYVDGKETPWRRDNVHMSGFHIDVPQGAKAITADFQYLTPIQQKDGVIVHTDKNLELQFWNLALYPAGYYTRRVPVKVAVTLPTGWQFGSALELDSQAGDVATFKPISFDNLVDSPLIAGKFFKRYDLDPGSKVPVHLDVVADNAADLEIPDAAVKVQANVVQEAYKLFGGQHYNHYDWLVAISDTLGGIGLEHHRSSEIGIEPGYFPNVAEKGFGRNIIAHEYIHSWDGKFRRPDGQFTADFEAPMRDDLLWVYEGGTTYWTDVLESRAGLYTFDQRLQMLAATAAQYDILPARQWRDLHDTTFDPILSDRGPKSWPSWQRSEDYYAEGGLIWLDADTLIREKTGGKKSLDDFAKAFFNVYNGSWLPAPYSFDTVVQALNSVYPYDWATFLNTRLTKVGGGAPLDGLARAGYRLVYDDAASDYFKSREARGGVNVVMSLGFATGKDGTVGQVLWGSPAFKAGFLAGDKVTAVNGHAFDGASLKAAIVASHAAGNSDTIKVLVLSNGEYRTISFDYHDGLRYPHLERIAGTADMLKPIFGAPADVAKK